MRDPSEVISADNFSCDRGDKIVLKNVSFRICKGQILLIRGKNGSGKTTLLRALLGLLPSNGTVYWNKDYRNPSYLSHKNAIKENETVLENLLFWARFYKIDNLNCNTILNKYGLKDYSDVPAGWLSSGQLKRLALARVFLLKRKVMLLDEPLNHLDSTAENMLINFLSEHLESGGVALVATHKNIKINSSILLDL